MVESASKSADLYALACELMPGGVNSPVRAFKAVGGTPVYFKKALGSKVWDVDGREYIDYMSSWGAVVLGHAYPAIVEAISKAAAHGTSFGAPHEGEITLAAEILKRMPLLERIRFVNSGTEAAMAAIRLARAATGRDKILKFEGNYHGAADSLLAKAGSGVATFSLPDSAGVPKEVAAGTLVTPYNSLAGVSEALEANKGEVAAVLVEPVAGNMGLVPPLPGFLEGLRKLCDVHDTLLILDEVMTGFRVAPGGAMDLYCIRPDLAIMGKVIGGGLPVGAYAGRKDLMEMIAPLGPVYQAGTLSGNPLAMAAGYAALTHLGPAAYAEMERIGTRLQTGLNVASQAAGVSAQVQRVGSMISIFFTEKPVTDFAAAQTTDRALFGRLFHELLGRGVYLPPSALESWFFTLSHTDAEIDRTLTAYEDSLREAKG